jgi:hypothetical protein
MKMKKEDVLSVGVSLLMALKVGVAKKNPYSWCERLAWLSLLQKQPQFVYPPVE